MTGRISIHFHPQPLAYDGSAIRPHWARRTFGIAGDCAVGFIGPCDVKREEVQDMDEFISGEAIRSENMVHIVAEHYGPDLDNAILKSRLAAALAFERLAPLAADRIARKGDDIFLDGKKMSVCVATVTPVSVKFHFGINVTGLNAPVDAAGLEDLNADPVAFARGLLEDYGREIEEAAAARCKARGL